MKKTALGIAFVIVVCAQLAVPAYMIHEREVTLREGRAYRFECAPVDPYDAFRGRYVALAVTERQFAGWSGSPLERGRRVYALLSEDEAGFADIVSLSLQPPAQGDYIRATVQWVVSGKGAINLRLPFDRYYMDENLAPQAERAYRQGNRAGENKAYITVRVRNGAAVLEELYIEDLPIRDYLSRHPDIG